MGAKVRKNDVLTIIEKFCIFAPDKVYVSKNIKYYTPYSINNKIYSILYPIQYIMKENKLSLFVKSKRKIYHLTQVELSEKSGVGLRFVRDLEQGKSTLRMDKVNQVLNMFGAELGPVAMERDEL